MADDSMDFKTDAILGADVPTELLEPPPMDLEETSGPQDLTEDPSTQQKPSSSSGSLDVTLMPPNVEPSNPVKTEFQTRLGYTESPEWLLDPQNSSPPVSTEVGLEGSRSAMEEGVTECPQEPRLSWVTDRGLAAEVGNDRQAPSGIDQSDPLMELELGEEDAVPDDVPEVNQIQLQGLLVQLERLSPRFHDNSPNSDDCLLLASDGEESPAFGGGEEEQRLLLKCQGPPGKCGPCPLHIATGHGLRVSSRWPTWPTRGPQKSRGLLSAETEGEDLLNLLCYEGGTLADLDDQTPLAHSDVVAGSGGRGLKAGGRAETSLGLSEEAEREEPCQWVPREGIGQKEESSSDSSVGRSRKGELPYDGAGSAVQENKVDLASFPAYKDVPGPCEPEDLREGVIFGAKYLGSTQLVSEKNPPSSVRMAQAQEAMDRIKAPEGESQPMTEVDLFVSTQRIKVLTTDSQEAMMDHPLQTISYIADIGNVIVLMARRKLPRRSETSTEKQLYKMICHVFHSADAQLIAQAIGQAFSVAYQHFLRASGIDPSRLSPRRPDDDEDSDDDTLAKGEELYNGDLAHFSKQENCKKVVIPKQKGEILGVVIVESGWGSILPTVVIANLMHGGAAERSGKLSIGDRIMSVNEMSLVGLPLASCQNIIRDLKNQMEVTLSVVHCPPVTTAIVRRPDAKYPLGFCVENGIICSLMRGGIAERGGIRVGHHIIEINGQSVVAMPHEKIIQILTQAVSEVHIKTMPASTYRLLTGQEQPVFL